MGCIWHREGGGHKKQEKELGGKDDQQRIRTRARERIKYKKEESTVRKGVGKR